MSYILLKVYYLLICLISFGFSLNTQNTRISIIGAGPTSLTLALALEKLGINEINIYEKRESLEFDINQSFLYLIDGRGQRILKELDLLDSIKINSVSSYQFKTLTEIKANNEINILKLPTIDNNSIEKFWVPRHEFINVLYQKVLEKPNISIHFNTKVDDIHYDNELKIETSQSSLVTLSTEYIFGCDGVNSIIRNLLNNKFTSTDKKSFQLVTYKSPSTGLRFKILPLLADFKYNNNQNETIISNSTTAYAIRSANSKGNQRLSLGLLPFSKYQTRTANIIVKKDHEIWKLKGFNDHLNFFVKSFPQLTILDNFISKEGLEQFSSSQGGIFPNIQYSKSLFKKFPNGKGIALFGDSAHAFPPDLGQGVNSGIEDVYYFYNEMKETSNNIEKSLELYEKKRLPEIIALCKIMVFGYPTQYKGISIFRDGLWKMNFVMRFILNKIAPKIFSLPSFTLIQNEKLSYTEILQTCNKTTRNIIIMFLSSLAFVVMGKSYIKSVFKNFLF